MTESLAECAEGIEDVESEAGVEGACADTASVAAGAGDSARDVFTIPETLAMSA